VSERYKVGTNPFPTGPGGAEAEAGGEVDPLIGQLLGGRYRVIERLAAGGMGTVYRAEQLALRKEVAIKLVQDGANSEHAMRFLREAMLTSRIDHPNVISAIDYGTFEDGTAYLVMSLVEGPTLARVMEIERPMSWVRAAEIAAQIADAVAAAQAEGIVHRDLKPENVLLQPMPDGSDVVKVLDFGIAKYARDSMAPPSFRGHQHVTRMGVVVGTPGYMAPEQAVGMRADHRADLYAIGVMLWECVVGCRLWNTEDIQQLLTAQLGTRPPLVREQTGDTTIPEAFEALVAQLLATRPEKRPQSAVETRDRLRALIDVDRHEWQPPEGAANAPAPEAGQPRLIVVTPPPPTSTVFIDAALARWQAAAGQAMRDKRAQSGVPQSTTNVFVPIEVSAGPQPATQIGFRGSRPASDEAPESPAPAPQPAAAPEHTPAEEVAFPPAPWQLRFALPLAMALSTLILWVALASGSHETPKVARGSLNAAAAKPASAKPVSATPPPAAPIPSVLPSAPALQPAPAQPTASAAATKPAKPESARAARARANALRAKARAHFRHAEFEFAAQTYRLAIKAAPGYAGAYAGLGASQLALGDARGAISSYSQAIRRSPSSSGFHAALGRAYLMAGERERAIAEYRKAVALDPSNEIAAVALARLSS
jgi:tetratricopeptide (TPR) repeat protein